MKFPFRTLASPAIGALILALPVLLALPGCGGGSSFVPNPTATPRATATPVPTPQTSFAFTSVSSDFNGNSAPIVSGNGSFTRRKTATTDGIDAIISIGANPTRLVTLSISTAGALSADQRFRIGVSDDFNASTSVTYTETRPDQFQLWVSQGGPGVSGSISILALSDTAVTLKLEGAQLSRRNGEGPPAQGNFILNGTLSAGS